MRESSLASVYFNLETGILYHKPKEDSDFVYFDPKIREYRQKRSKGSDFVLRQADLEVGRVKSFPSLLKSIDKYCIRVKHIDYKIPYSLIRKLTMYKTLENYLQPIIIWDSDEPEDNLLLTVNDVKEALTKSRERLEKEVSRLIEGKKNNIANPEAISEYLKGQGTNVKKHFYNELNRIGATSRGFADKFAFSRTDSQRYGNDL